jgi:CRP/FNR family cyclic AMP-dependent transcriptional regulator
MTITTEEKADWLARVDLFSGIDQDGLRRVAELAGEIQFPQGRHIVQQGLVGNGLYILVGGAADVVRSGEVLATLQPGDFFGELAVIDQMPRSASVVASEPTTCLALASWDLLDLLAREPRISLNLLRTLATRLRSAQEHHRH